MSVLAVAASASAEPKDAQARSMAKEAMDGDYLSTQFPEAEQKLQKALKACGASGCSASVLGELHLDLAVVLFADKQKDKAKQEVRAALKADPAAQLNPDFSTPELEQAFGEAGGAAADAEPLQTKPEPEAKEGEREDSPPAAPPSEDDSAAAGPKNWLSLAFQQDLLSYKDTTGVCTGAAQYQCFLQGQQYGGNPYRGSGNQLQGGVGFATKRILLGYDRVLGENLTLGAKLGFAFGGSPKAPGGSAFLPLHAEARGSYWFGHAPFASAGLRGYAGLALGFGEVDGHVTVEYYENDQGYANGAKGKLDAWRKTGKGFAGLHAGAAYAFTKQQQIFLELRVLQLLGATALGGAVSVGYAFGI